MIKNKNNFLIVGFQDKFENSIIDEFKTRLDSVFVISSTSKADVDFWDLHFLRIEFQNTFEYEEFTACIKYINQNYEVISNISNRGFYYLPRNSSENKNYISMLANFYFGYIKKNNIKNVIFSNIPHEANIYTLYLVSKFLKLNIVFCYQSHIPDRFFLINDISQFGNFKNIKLSNRLSAQYSLPKEWSYMRNLKKDFSYNLSNLLKEVITKPIRAPLAMVRYFHASCYRKNIKKYTKKVDFGSDYVYFPLQLQPELTSSILGGDYSDQLLALESLSNSIPDGMRIYVKENPKQTELERGEYFFKRLSQLKNVELVGRSEDSRRLIKNSRLVALLNGTAGWEALFFKKSVLVFGRCWYQHFPGVKIYTPGMRFVEMTSQNFYTESELSKMHNDIMERAGKGVVDDHWMTAFDKFDKNKNAKCVVDSVLDFMEFRLNGDVS
ncbi:hypothetical protein G6700_01750 [Polynucleobacter paneuropaeus]|nr:hypothetical protein G6700_01750 [Polynucleobacter paneuropaeus]